ncbi:MAG: tetratricopeptide repeat protein [Candidatus Hodarchaeota archaeon]
MSDSEIIELNKVKQLTYEGRIKEALQIILDIEERSNLSNQNLISFMLLKLRLLYRSSKYSKTLSLVIQFLQETQKQGDLPSYFEGLLIQAYSLLMMGDLSKSSIALKKAEEIFENLKGVSKTDLREKESYMIRIKAINAGLTGNSQLSLMLNEKAFELAKYSEDKERKSSPLLNLAESYHFLGDYDKAINYAKRALEVGYPPRLLNSFGLLIDSYLGKGDTINAKYYFQLMSDLIEKDKQSYSELLYHYYKALILKTSLRARDRIEAEDLFKQVAEEKENFQFVIKAIINICDLLLIELRITNDSDIINEINPYIKKLLKIAEHQKSYYFAAETFLLQGKISLLIFNFKEAKRFFTQAQQIAERFDHIQLAQQISKEKEDLNEKSVLWHKLKEVGAPMIERLELARIDELIEKMNLKPIILRTQVKEEEVIISKEKKMCLVCKGEVLGFSYICKCGAIYCENCARALTNLENLCWVCDIPIDSLKPTISYKEEESIDLEIKGKN